MVAFSFPTILRCILMDPSTDIRPSREPRKSKRIQEATSNYNSGMLMRTRGVEGWYIDGDAVNYGFVSVKRFNRGKSLNALFRH